MSTDRAFLVLLIGLSLALGDRAPVRGLILSLLVLIA